MRGGQNARKSPRGYLWCPYTWLFLLIEYNVSLFSVLFRYVKARACALHTYVYAMSYVKKNYIDS